MREENNDIFLASGDALVYLAVTKHKIYSIAFFLVHTFIQYVRILGSIFQTPPPPPTTTLLLCKPIYAFTVTVSAVELFQLF